MREIRKRAVVIEEVAGDQQQIDAIGEHTIDDALEDEPLSLAMAVGPVAVAVEVQVRGVQDA